jgi:hypothetical protein
MIATGRALGLVTLVLLALASPAGAADVDKFLPEDTAFVTSINVKQIVASPLFKEYGEKRLRELLKSQDEASRILEDLGFDPFKDLDSITTAGASVGPESKPYIIAHGKFNLAKFSAKAEEAAKDHGDLLKIQKDSGHTFYEVTPPAGDTLFVGLVDGHTLVAAVDKGFVVQSFARAGEKESKVKKEIRDLVEKVDSNLSMWAAVPGTTLSQSELGKDEQAKKIVDKIDGVIGSIAIDKDIKLSAALTAGSADNAKQLSEGLTVHLESFKKMIQMFPTPPEFQPLINLANDIKVSVQGSAVAIKAEVSEETIKEVMKKLQ